MRLKSDVKITGIRPEMILGIIVATRVYDEMDYEFVITSGLEGTHSKTSLHYAGAAIDIRTRHLPAGAAQAARDAIANALTNEYDVILEGNHIHLEWQPKRPDNG